MITAILSLLGSSAIGSIIGGVFALLNRKADVEAKRLDHSHELEMRRADMELAKLEAEGRLQVAMVEADGMIESSRMDAIGQAHQADVLDAKQIQAAGKVGGFLLVLTDVFRRLIRPVITVVLVCGALYINWMLIGRMGLGWDAMDAAQRFEIGLQALGWMTGQASSVVAYWFVSRTSTK